MTTGEMHSGVVTVGGAAIHYDEAGTGQPLLLIHGGLVDRRSWDDQIPAFAAQYRVIRYDMPGSGDSPSRTGEYELHEDAFAVLQALGIDSAHVLGLSLGSRIAIDLALAHPEAVTALIAVAPAIGGTSFSDEIVARFDEIDEAYESEGIDAAVELENRLWIDGPYRSPEATDPGTRTRVIEMNRRIYEQASDDDSPQWLDPPAAERLASITAPTLTIVGALDIPDIIENANLLAAQLPHCRLQVIPNTAHAPNMERPEMFNSVVLEFLAGVRV